MNATDNKLLERLHDGEYSQLAAHFQHVTLERGDVVSDVGDDSRFLFFPSGGVLSLVGTTENGATVEVADIGAEGVANICALLGGSWLPFRVITKVGGSAVRIPTDVVARQLHECGDFHQRILVFANGVITQIAQSAVCNRYHNAKQRLARWLLTTADRAGDLALPLTHEFISSMVGGPRSAVTEASAELRDAGAIEYKRGLLEISDIEKLRAESCECYLAVRGAMHVAGQA